MGIALAREVADAAVVVSVAIGSGGAVSFEQAASAANASASGKGLMGVAQN
jgi:hypothetical protein